ncbi:sugar transport protein 8-like [Wolffia australiana]
MAPVVAPNAADQQVEFAGKNTIYVMICGVVAASGGLMFGYDVGISGGVMSMDEFLEKFFPEVLLRRNRAKEDNYCKFDNHYLQLFTSSLYMSALLSSFVASKMCSSLGRKPTMRAASLFFLLGVLLNAFAVNLAMLITGRILFGIGVGLANHAVPLFLSEIALVKIRGALSILFQLNITVGILAANVVNYFMAEKHPWGWRASLGVAGVPACVLCIGSLFITETPTSLIEREKLDEGLAMLRKIRGVDKVDAEFDELVQASEQARRMKHPFRNLAKRRSRPQLVIAIAMQVFQQFTGINAIMFYAPMLFQSMGFKSNASLLSSLIIGALNVVCTDVCAALVDKVGRRALLLEACLQMLVSHVAIGVILATNLTATNELSRELSFAVVVLICLFISGFAWSWGPLGWLIPSEIFPLETRTAGYAFAVSSNMLFTFVIAQTFLSMMCRMRAGIFFFFAAWIVVMGLFAVFLLPETKGIPIDEMVDRVWKRHWYWKRFMDEDEAIGQA